MLNRTIVVPVALAGVLSALFALALEQILLLPREGVAFGAQPQPVIQAQQFELVDATGTVRGVLRMAPEGTGPEVALLDEAGHRRATMRENAEGEYASASWIPVALSASRSGRRNAALSD